MGSERMESQSGGGSVRAGLGVSKEDAGYGQRLHNDSKGETGSFIPRTFTTHLTRVRTARNWGCGDAATNAHLGLAAHCEDCRSDEGHALIQQAR